MSCSRTIYGGCGGSNPGPLAPEPRDAKLYPRDDQYLTLMKDSYILTIFNCYDCEVGNGKKCVKLLT